MLFEILACKKKTTRTKENKHTPTLDAKTAETYSKTLRDTTTDCRLRQRHLEYQNINIITSSPSQWQL